MSCRRHGGPISDRTAQFFNRPRCVKVGFNRNDAGELRITNMMKRMPRSARKYLRREKSRLRRAKGEGFAEEIRELAGRLRAAHGLPPIREALAG